MKIIYTFENYKSHKAMNQNLSRVNWSTMRILNINNARWFSNNIYNLLNNLFLLILPNILGKIKSQDLLI